jgi:PAS domain S-box-containing protein
MWMLSTDLMMVTSRDGVILSVNPAWTRLLGWREEELVGASFYTFVHPDDRDRTRIGRLVVEQGGVIEKLENRYLTRDGRTVWLSWKAVPDGDLVHSVARDITAEREQADALRAAEEALRHAQKMEAVGQLTGGIAHDFNNLLQGIVGALQLSEKRIAEGRLEDLTRYNTQAQQCAERAAALTHRLLAFSRRQPLDPRTVQANQLILTMEPLLRRTLGESVRLDLDLAPDLWPILCDPNQLDSAILNLSINARDAMPHGGVLTIRSRNAPNVEGDAGGEAVCLTVEDTGVGMAADVITRAFDPFFTTKPIGQGTGLGLSMVYGFMRQSGGEAKIASAPGAGTTVALHFQRHAGHADSTPGSVSPGAAAPRGEGAVLVIEDEVSVRGFVVEVLQQLGFQVIAAHDGPSGVEILRSPRPIDLLVTDIGLPGLNGRQVVDIARQTRPGLKVLFMTGYAESASVADGFLEPGMGLITKPFPLETLAERIQSLRQS